MHTGIAHQSVGLSCGHKAWSVFDVQHLSVTGWTLTAEPAMRGCSVLGTGGDASIPAAGRAAAFSRGLAARNGKEVAWIPPSGPLQLERSGLCNLCVSH